MKMKWARPAIGSNAFACVQLESRSSPISQSGVLVVLFFPTKCSWFYAHIAAQLQGKIITIECGTSSSRSSNFIRQQSIADERVCLCFIGVCVLIWTVQCVYCHRLINGNRACFCVIGRLRSSVFFRRFFFSFCRNIEYGILRMWAEVLCATQWMSTARSITAVFCSSLLLLSFARTEFWIDRRSATQWAQWLTLAL